MQFSIIGAYASGNFLVLRARADENPDLVQERLIAKELMLSAYNPVTFLAREINAAMTEGTIDDRG
jgi:hypothetical protein